MIIDSLLEFSDAQAPTSTGRNNSTNVVDTGAVAVDPGAGEPLYLGIVCEEDADSTGDGASVEFILASDSAASVATDGSATDHFSTGAIAEASLLAGNVVAMVALPNGGVNAYERYLAVQYNITGEALTAGKFSAFLTKDPHRIYHYPQAANVVA